MPGYGGQTLALDVTPFSQLQRQAAEAQQAQTEADYMAQSSPLRLRQLELQNEQTQAGTESTRAGTEGQNISNETNRPGIRTAQENAQTHTADYWRLETQRGIGQFDVNQANPEQAWDRYWTQQRDRGNPNAEQFIGHFSPERYRAWAAQWAQPASNPLAGSEASRTANAPRRASPEQIQQWDAQTRDMTPEQIQQAATFHQQLSLQVQRVSQIADPAQRLAAFHEAAAALGHPEYQSITSILQADQILQQLLDVEAPLAEYLSGRVTMRQSGMPNPPYQQQLQTDSAGNVYAVTPSGPNGATASPTPIIRAPATPGPAQGYTTDEHGNSHVVYGPSPTVPHETVGGTNMTGTRYGGLGRENTTETRERIGTRLGLTGQALADFITGHGGQGGRSSMSPARIRTAAMTDARVRADNAQRQQNLSDPDHPMTTAQRDELYQRYLSENMAAFDSDTPESGGSSAPTPGGVPTRSVPVGSIRYAPMTAPAPPANVLSQIQPGYSVTLRGADGQAQTWERRGNAPPRRVR